MDHKIRFLPFQVKWSGETAVETKKMNLGARFTGILYKADRIVAFFRSEVSSTVEGAQAAPPSSVSIRATRAACYSPRRPLRQRLAVARSEAAPLPNLASKTCTQKLLHLTPYFLQ